MCNAVKQQTKGKGADFYQNQHLFWCGWGDLNPPKHKAWCGFQRPVLHFVLHAIPKGC